MTILEENQLNVTKVRSQMNLGTKRFYSIYINILE